MLRKLLGLVAAAAMVSAFASNAWAGVFLPLSSDLSVNLGGNPTISLPGNYDEGGWATLTDNGSEHDLAAGAGIWKGAGIAAGNGTGTALLTGVALLDNLTLSVTNNSGSFTAAFSTTNPVGGGLTGGAATSASGTLCPSGCLGGQQGLSGNVYLYALGTSLPFPLQPAATRGVGIGGTATVMLGTVPIVVTNAPWITGKVRITSLTTNVIEVVRGGNVLTGVGVTLAPAGTEDVRTFTTGLGWRSTMSTASIQTRGTVTVGGTNILASASAGGAVTLISPQRINTGPIGLGNIPAVWRETFVFVPEPGTVLLLVSGAAGLVVIGRNRMKRK
jgi:hypothetical protein